MVDVAQTSYGESRNVHSARILRLLNNLLEYVHFRTPHPPKKNCVL